MKQKIPEPRICRNPLCGKVLPPNHPRKDCDDPCKNAYFYQNRKAEGEAIYSYERVLKNNEKHVKALYANTFFRRVGVPKEALEGQGINLEVFINGEQHTTRKTGLIWFGRYGVELPAVKGGNFMLLERSDDRVPKYRGGLYV